MDDGRRRVGARDGREQLVIILCLSREMDPMNRIAVSFITSVCQQTKADTGPTLGLRLT